MNDLDTFLGALWGDGPHSLCLMRPGGTFRAVGTFATPEALVDAARRNGGRDVHLWWGAHALANVPASGRGDALDVAEIVCLIADLDWESDGAHAGSDLPTEAELRRLVAGLGEIGPSIVVNSGHGLQCYWPLAWSMPADEGLILQERLSALLADRGLINDRGDLASVLRLPGSYNVKTEPIRVVIERLDVERRFVPQYLAARLPPAVGSAGRHGPATKHTPGATTDAQFEMLNFVRDHHGGHSPWFFRDGSVHVVRPGKDAYGGTSASIIVGERGDALLTVFSRSWPLIGPVPPAEASSWVLDAGELRPAGAVEDPILLKIPTIEPEQLQLPGLESSWLPLDLGPVLAAGYAQPMPTILKRSDLESDGSLFYTSAINGVHGDSGTGKSWVALSAIKTLIVNGYDAVLVDLEDTPGSIVSRLRLLSVTDEAIERHLIYIRPIDSPTLGDIERLAETVAERDVRLVVIDSLGEAFGLDGVDENSDAEVGPWIRRNLRPLADAGAAVLVIDHATKAADNPLHPSGSKRKRAAITGASYLVTAVVALVKGEGGCLHLTCAKDRHGNYRRGDVVTRLLMDASGYDLRIRFDPPRQEDLDAEAAEERETLGMARLNLAVAAVVEVLADGAERSKRKLEAAVMSKLGIGSSAARDAIDIAEERGLATSHAGPNRSRNYCLAPASEEPS